MSDIEQRLREALDGVEEGLRLAEVGEYLYNECAYSYGDGRTEPREYGIEWQWQQAKPDEYGQGQLLAASTKWHAEQAADGIGTEATKLRDTIASLRSKLEEAEGARDRLAKKIAACNWYWPEDDTSSEACFESAQEVLDSAYIKRGEVLAVARGGVVEVTYCASLPPADDADSDDEFWVEEKTYEAAALKVAEEQSRRTLSSLREADHA